MEAVTFSNLLKEKGLTLGSVESFTGGLFAREITKIPGASKFYKGGLVTYWTEEKIKVLGIGEELVHQFGVVSKECAYEMAKNGKNILGVDICVSFTGNAGPDAMENKPVGEIYIGISIFDRVLTFPYALKGDRNEIQEKAVSIAYELIAKELK